MAGQNMTVDAIEARRDLTAVEPVPMRVLDAVPQLLRRLRQGRRRRFVPVQVRGLLGPEGLGVSERVRLYFVLEVIGHVSLGSENKA